MPGPVKLQLATSIGRTSAEGILAAIQIGLKGWKNFKIKGQDIEYETKTIKLAGRDVQGVSFELLDLIPMEVLLELGKEILAMNEISKGESKN